MEVVWLSGGVIVTLEDCTNFLAEVVGTKEELVEIDEDKATVETEQVGQYMDVITV